MAARARVLPSPPFPVIINLIGEGGVVEADCDDRGVGDTADMLSFFSLTPVTSSIRAVTLHTMSDSCLVLNSMGGCRARHHLHTAALRNTVSAIGNLILCK